MKKNYVYVLVTKENYDIAYEERQEIERDQDFQEGEFIKVYCSEKDCAKRFNEKVEYAKKFIECQHDNEYGEYHIVEDNTSWFSAYDELSDTNFEFYYVKEEVE